MGLLYKCDDSSIWQILTGSSKISMRTPSRDKLMLLMVSVCLSKVIENSILSKYLGID